MKGRGRKNINRQYQAQRRRRSGAWAGAGTVAAEKIIAAVTAAALAGAFFLLLVPAAAVMISDGVPGGFGSTADNSDQNGGLQLKNIIREKVELPDTVKVWVEDEGKCVKVDFEEYVCSVVASEMPWTFELEALKAQSVAARTYAASKLEAFEEGTTDAQHPEAAVCNTTHCQVYKTEKELIACHDEGWEEEGWQKIQKACKATEGEILYYEGSIVTQPLFFSSSGGQTENSEDVFTSAYPYLVSVSSPYEDEATHTDEEKVFTISEISERFNAVYGSRDIGNVSKTSLKILSRTSGGRVSQMQIGDGSQGTFKGTEVRSALGLSSALFTISFSDDEVHFVSSGSGHGVGMSQYGADGMAANGSDYKEILTHYYTGTEVY